VKKSGLKSTSAEQIQIDRMIRSRRRSIGLEISDDARLIVRAPFAVSSRTINRVILKKKEWILRKQLEARARLAQTPQRQFAPGESFLFLGNTYPLIYVGSRQHPFGFQEDSFFLIPKHQIRARELFVNWYRKNAQKIFAERINHYQNLSGIRYRQLKISNARKRWGSCNSRGDLYLNWRLVMAPLEVIDYVVVHELSHIREGNHSRSFWDLVEQLIPDYRNPRKWLKNHGHLLNL
jgi:predicted metal-dependent hydrolase